ncbi:MAG: hypothetical protein ABFD97_08140 [Syntrophobacter sp.]
MKKAMILHVTDVEEDVSPEGVSDLIKTLRSMGISTVLVAKSDQEVLRGWSLLISKGVRQVMLMKVYYSPSMNWFESRNAPSMLRQNQEGSTVSILN